MFEGNPARNPEKKPAAECDQVKLYFMIPPISKMDAAALCTLTACSHLALSTNNIDKIANLSGMENLKILSLGRNNIKKLENLDGIGGKLEQLWVSYNPIDKLTGIEKLKMLKVLFMGNCKVASDKEFMRLAELPALEEVVFFGNPLHKSIIEKDGELGWPKFVLSVLPGLRKLDGISMVEWKQKLAGGGREPKLKEIYEKCNGAANGSVTTMELKAALSDADIQSSLSITGDKVEETFKGISDATMTLDNFISAFK